MPTLLEAALWYARVKGMAVFPVHYPKDGFCSCGGIENCAPCKHPMVKGGLLAATTDEKQIRAWWTRWPSANIGYRPEPGRVVLDVDKYAGGEETLLAHEPIQNTPETVTPKGGSHLFLNAGNVPLKNAARKLPGLDLRTNEGYVLLPPSETLDGCYAWKSKLNGHFENCPEYIVEAFKKEPRESAEPALLPESLEVGHRDDLLFRNACRMRYSGMEYDEIASALAVVNQRRCVPPLPQGVVLQKAAQAAKYPRGDAGLLRLEDPLGYPEGVCVGMVGDLAGEYRNVGMPTGFRFIDENCTPGGLKNGQVSVFSAFTGVGKTGMLLQIADYAASQGITVCFGTFADSDATEIRDRLLIMRTGWKGAEGPMESLRRALWLDEKESIEKLPIHIWDATTGYEGRRVDPFLEWCRKIGPGLIIGDYAQKIKSDKAKTMFDHAEAACGALALAAKQMDIPVVLGSQLTRGNAKMGTVDTTRGSQEWEHAAAFHMKIRVFDAKEAEKLEVPFATLAGISEWQIAKNRFTVEFPPQRQTYVRWNVKTIKFEEL